MESSKLVLAILDLEVLILYPVIQESDVNKTC